MFGDLHLSSLLFFQLSFQYMILSFEISAFILASSPKRCKKCISLTNFLSQVTIQEQEVLESDWSSIDSNDTPNTPWMMITDIDMIHQGLFWTILALHPGRSGHWMRCTLVQLVLKVGEDYKSYTLTCNNQKQNDRIIQVGTQSQVLNPEHQDLKSI